MISKGGDVRQKILEAMTTSEIKKLRPWKLMCIGDEGTGKTHFSLTFLLYAYYELGLELDDLLMVFIDPDEGEVPLLDAEVIPSHIQERMRHFNPKNWKDLVSATDQAYEMLSKHCHDRGRKGWYGSIIIVENRGDCWQWAQDDYVYDVYKKTFEEKELDAKKTAQSEGKKMHPTLNPMMDYGAINRKYGSWADGMKNSGYNFIWTAHLKTVTVAKGKDETEVIKEKTEGQRADPGRVDVVLKFHSSGGKFLVDIDKRRGLTSRFEDQEDLDFSKFVRLYNKLQNIDKDRRKETFDKMEEKRRNMIEERKKKAEKTAEAKVEIKSEVKPEIKSEIKPEIKTEVESEIEPEIPSKEVPIEASIEPKDEYDLSGLDLGK